MNKILIPEPELYVMYGSPVLTLRDYRTGRIKQVIEVPNLIAQAGRTSLANRLSNKRDTPVAAGTSAAKLGIINCIAVGTGTGLVDYTSLTISGEVARVATSAASTYAGTQATISGFFSSGQANGTLTRVGLFGDLDPAPGAANTGTLYAYTTINLTKSNQETLTVDWKITFGV